MSKATVDSLDALHAKLAETLKRKLEDGTATAADLNVIRAFLKDNNIEGAAVPGSPIRQLGQALTDSLPFAGTDQAH